MLQIRMIKIMETIAKLYLINLNKMRQIIRINFKSKI
jgi:hypothetical protein